jgi:hypothetical protein
MSLGHDRVRGDFNPSKDDLVTKIKSKTAELIDLCDSHRAENTSMLDAEEERLWALAMTHFEDAAMWAVKAATTKK